ncbi:DUF3592 domain-containing protein [Desulfovibrio oxyclinae]|uniref:DUF3592 domain-containing protein n=1 Tax=Desulfovibrio oxyclinae TaxID=63560 RepID=UPI0003757C80|nr:DUF3592 domain-containing protein [Desulfovibrio oxyclinae]
MFKQMLDPSLSFSIRLKKGIQLFLAVGLTLLFLWLLYKVPYQMIREERVRLLGETKTTGEVLLKEKSSTSTSFETPWHTITFKYVDNDGYTRTEKVIMKEAYWQQLRPGSVVTVWFARAKPDLVRVEGMVESEMQTRLRNWLEE